MEIFISFITIILSIFLLNKILIRKSQNLPPSPFSIPIIGHLHLIKKPLHETLEELQLQYGPIIYLRFGSRKIVVVSTPSTIEECFTKNDIILANRPRTVAGDCNTYNYTAVGFAPYGQLWRSLRRFTTLEIFCSRSVKKYSSVRETEVIETCRKLFKMSCNNPRKVDLKFVFSCLTTNIILRMVCGKRGVQEMISRDGNDFVEAEKRFLREFKSMFYSITKMSVCDYFPILRFVGYKGIEKNSIKIHKIRDEYLQNLLDEVRVKRRRSSKEIDSEEDEKWKMSIIEDLLVAQESEPGLYSDDLIKGVVLIMFTAGADTSGITMQWAMSLLLTHPDKMRKLRQEIDDHVGNDNILRDSDLSKLPYLRCVVYETLRLYPAAPLLLPHCPSEDCTIGGYDVPKGSTILVNARTMHRDPNLWDHPTKFEPERFEGLVGEREGFKFIPFGAGRRACPAAALGIRMVSLALGALLQCFEFEKVEMEVDMTESVALLLDMGTPLEVICRPRIRNPMQCFSVFE